LHHTININTNTNNKNNPNHTAPRSSPEKPVRVRAKKQPRSSSSSSSSSSPSSATMKRHPFFSATVVNPIQGSTLTNASKFLEFELLSKITPFLPYTNFTLDFFINGESMNASQDLQLAWDWNQATVPLVLSQEWPILPVGEAANVTIKCTDSDNAQVASFTSDFIFAAPGSAEIIMPKMNDVITQDFVTIQLKVDNFAIASSKVYEVYLELDGSLISDDDGVPNALTDEVNTIRGMSNGKHSMQLLLANKVTKEVLSKGDVLSFTVANGDAAAASSTTVQQQQQQMLEEQRMSQQRQREAAAAADVKTNKYELMETKALLENVDSASLSTAERIAVLDELERRWKR
jgi:hypothetical protein